jgi:endonuclease III
VFRFPSGVGVSFGRYVCHAARDEFSRDVLKRLNL